MQSAMSNVMYISVKTVHLFEEIIFILDYVLVGYSLDSKDQEEEKEDIDFSKLDENLDDDESITITNESWEK